MPDALWSIKPAHNQKFGAKLVSTSLYPPLWTRSPYAESGAFTIRSHVTHADLREMDATEKDGCRPVTCLRDPADSLFAQGYTTKGSFCSEPPNLCCSLSRPSDCITREAWTLSVDVGGWPGCLRTRSSTQTAHPSTRTIGELLERPCAGVSGGAGQTSSR